MESVENWATRFISWISIKQPKIGELRSGGYQGNLYFVDCNQAKIIRRYRLRGNASVIAEFDCALNQLGLNFHRPTTMELDSVVRKYLFWLSHFFLDMTGSKLVWFTLILWHSSAFYLIFLSFIILIPVKPRIKFIST